MFTGLVETIGVMDSVTERSPGRRLVLRTSVYRQQLTLGESVAVDGCCLTVVHSEGDTFSVDAGPETLAKTNLFLRKTGDQVNLERAMRADGRLGGHLVQGHVDGIATLERRSRDRDWELFTFRTSLASQLVSKGSVTVDGVSLTVVNAEDDRFSVALIPHTLAVTTLGKRVPGDRVNIETDIIGKYVWRYLAATKGNVGSGNGLSQSLLKDAGFSS